MLLRIEDATQMMYLQDIIVHCMGGLVVQGMYVLSFDVTERVVQCTLFVFVL